MVSVLATAVAAISLSFIRHDLSSFSHTTATENGSYVRFVHPTNSLPFEPDMPVYVELDLRSENLFFCLEVHAGESLARRATQRLSQSRDRNRTPSAWTWLTAFHFTMTDAHGACSSGPCDLRVNLLAAERESDCLAEPYKRLDVLASDTVLIVALRPQDGEPGSAIDCDFGRHEAALSTLPLQFMPEHSRMMLGCLRSCHFRDVCVRHRADDVPHIFVIHGERLKHGSDIWKLPPPHLGLCSNFMSNTPTMPFVEVTWPHRPVTRPHRPSTCIAGGPDLVE